MGDNLRYIEGTSPPEVLIVEGGCEMRAQMHGYVPPGQPAWPGCVHRRYQWNGSAFVEVKKKP